MKWGFFGTVHIVSLVIALGIVVGLYLILKKLPKKAQIAILGVLSFSGVFAIVYNLLAYNDPVYYLPLHLCSLNAMALPFAVFTRRKSAVSCRKAERMRHFVTGSENHQLHSVGKLAYLLYLVPSAVYLGLEVIISHIPALPGG